MNNKNYKKQLEELITQSELEEQDKGLWALFLAIAPPEEDEAVYEAVCESKENLNMLTKHLQDKIFSMQNISRDGWQRLVCESGEIRWLYQELFIARSL